MSATKIDEVKFTTFLEIKVVVGIQNINSRIFEWSNFQFELYSNFSKMFSTVLNSFCKFILWLLIVQKQNTAYSKVFIEVHAGLHVHAKLQGFVMDIPYK